MSRTSSIFVSLLAGFLSCITVYSQVDSPPKPYGGNQRMREFMCNEMVYPEDAIENKTEGTVEVLITVLQDGTATNHRIWKSVSPELDDEALRLSKLVLFYPGTKSGNTVIEDVSIPVKFNIKKYKRNCKQKEFEKYEQYSGPVDNSLQVYPTKALDRSPQPVFLDPEMTFSRFITENLKYPELAYTQNIDGVVVLSFIVETSGRISNLEVVSPLGGGCTEEAIQLIKQILWKPGTLEGKAVRTFLTANISFSLHNNSNHQYLPNNNNTTM